jgi:hypothetical protein
MTTANRADMTAWTRRSRVKYGRTAPGSSGFEVRNVPAGSRRNPFAFSIMVVIIRINDKPTWRIKLNPQELGF